MTHSEENGHARTRAEEGQQDAIINAASQKEKRTEGEIRGGDGEQVIKKQRHRERRAKESKKRGGG